MVIFHTTQSLTETEANNSMQCLIMHDVTVTRYELVGRDWLQQLCLVVIGACKNMQETFTLFQFYFSASAHLQWKKIK